MAKKDEVYNKMRRIMEEMDVVERRLHTLEIKRDELYNKREQLTKEYQKLYEEYYGGNRRKVMV